MQTSSVTPLPKALGTTDLHPHSSALSRMFRMEWYNARLWGLAAFTQHRAFEVHPWSCVSVFQEPLSQEIGCDKEPWLDDAGT